MNVPWSDETQLPRIFQANQEFPRGSLLLCAMDNPRNVTAEAEIQQLIQTYQPDDPDPPLLRRPDPMILQLPIPSPQVYFDNYHHPQFPNVFPAIHSFPDPESAPYAFPQPMGPLPADRYNILGVKLHDYGHINRHPEKLFIKYMLWYLEIDDHLIRSICPSDLNDMPCEWDELQGGCPMLRLCKIKHKYPHPHLSVIPECTPANRHNCKFLHDIDTNCRSIGKQLRLPEEEQFRSCQLCKIVGLGGHCHWGHDLESARAEAVREYWRHREGARAHGSIGLVKWDIWGRFLSWTPQYPLNL